MWPFNSNLKYRVTQLEEQVKMLDKKYAVKLVERIVFGGVTLALTTLGAAWIANATGVLEKLV